MRKWAASKLGPRVYGERLDVSVNHEKISIIQALADAQNRVLVGVTIDAD